MNFPLPMAGLPRQIIERQKQTISLCPANEKKAELQQKYEQAFVSGNPRLISWSKQQMIPTLQMISPEKKELVRNTQ